MPTDVNLFGIHQKLKEKNARVVLNLDEIELSFINSQDKIELENLFKSIAWSTESFTPNSLSLKSEIQGVRLFDHIDSLLDRISVDDELLPNYNLFVFDVDGYYLHYNHQSAEVLTNSPLPRTKFLIQHFTQYKGLLDIYLENEGLLYEIKRSSASGSEFVVLSKGERKLVSSIYYKIIDKRIFLDDNINIPLDEFRTKMISEEWLACYNETICQFMEAQISQRRTFSNLFNNFNYLLNLTGQNFQLYILKFSFDKIRKQFKTEKNTYFDNLNAAQDKISSQIISVPISLGATIFSFYQFNSSPLILTIIYIAIFIYSLFIGFVVFMNLYDIQKIASDANEEEKNFRNHYPDLLNELKKDFAYMKNKRVRVRVLAWAIIVALVITLISLTVFLLNYQQVGQETIHFIRKI